MNPIDLPAHRPTRRWLAVSLAAIAIALVATPLARTAARVGPVAVPLGAHGPDQLPGEIVAITDGAFVPAVVTVPVGAVVRWVNTGQQVHSTTSDEGYWSWTLVPGSSFGVRFLSAGTYEYHCIYHPTMRGTVVVVPVADYTPAPTPEGTVTPTPPTPGIPPLPPFPPLPTPAPGPGSGAIVFDYFADEAARTLTDLFVVEPDGSGRRALTDTPGVAEAQPDWSPDQGEVVFTASPNAQQGPWALWAMEASGANRRQLTAGPADYEPHWHPSGDRIVFTRIRQSPGLAMRSEIAVVSPAGGDERPLLSLDSATHGLLNPAWSPDGQRIVFTVSSDHAGSELYLMNADGSGIRRLFNHPGWHDIDPVWSPDGRHIAFASGSTARHDIWLADLQRGVAGTIVRAATWDLRRPAWSPDGAWIVFNAQVDLLPPRWSLYLVPAMGGSVTGPVTMGVEPDWGGPLMRTPPAPSVTPGTPGTPPVFPTLPTPIPTPDGPTPTMPVPPTFELPTPGTEEPTPSPTATDDGMTPVPTATDEPTPTPGLLTHAIHLPVAVHDALLAP